MPRQIRRRLLRIYMGTPGNQLQGDAVRGLPVLLSYVYRGRCPEHYMGTFGEILLDSGAYSELTTGIKVDLAEYRDWYAPWVERGWPVAGLDDIRGDWKRSMSHYGAAPETFPTFHDTDPPELLDELIPMAQERGGWIGIGVMPPRTNRKEWLDRTLERIPPGLHVHGWALTAYGSHPRIDSVDSTHWMREAMKVRRTFPWLSYGEALEITVKKCQRWTVPVRVDDAQSSFMEAWFDMPTSQIRMPEEPAK